MSDSVAARLKDFPDRLSPMLVKELRQGLRAKAFVTMFLILQGLLALILLSAVGAQSTSRVGETVSQIIFFFMSLALLLFQPLRGMSALSSEMKANTLEIMVLTRLNAWRIVMGKWTAIVSQSALLMAAVIPYLILRYFLGGMQLFAELLMLGTIFLISATLTAITVGISSNRALLLRSLFPVFGIPAGFIFISSMIFGVGMTKLVEFFSLTTPEAVGIFAAIVFFSLYFGWLALDFGTSLIAPKSENRATLRRLIGFGLAVIVIALMLFWDNGWLLLIALFFLTPLILISLAEPMELTPPVVRRFARHGFLGRMAGRVLYPGWASGMIFSSILALLFLGALPIESHYFLSSLEENVIHLYGTVGGLVFPAVVLLFFEKRIQNRFTAYLIILASSVILMGFLSMMSEMMREDLILWLFVWLPPVIWPLWGEANDTTVVAVMAALIGAAYTLILLMAAWLALRPVRKMERELAVQAEESTDTA